MRPRSCGHQAEWTEKVNEGSLWAAAMLRGSCPLRPDGLSHSANTGTVRSYAPSFKDYSWDEDDGSHLQSQDPGGWGRRIDNSRQPGLQSEFQASLSNIITLSKNKTLRMALNSKLIGWSMCLRIIQILIQYSTPSLNYRWKAKPDISSPDFQGREYNKGRRKKKKKPVLIGYGTPVSQLNLAYKQKN